MRRDRGRGARPDELPWTARRAFEAARRFDPPPDLLRSIVTEAAATPQRRRRWSHPLLVGVSPAIGAVAAAAVIVAVVALRALVASPGAAPGASGPAVAGTVELRQPLSGGLVPWSADGGGVWLGSAATGTVVRLDPATGEQRGSVKVNAATAEPYDLVPVIDRNSVWVAGRDDRALVRIDRATIAITARLPIDAVAYRIAPAGATVWATDFDGSRVLHIDASDGSILGSITIPRPTGVAVVGREVWVVDYVGDIYEIDPGSSTVVRRGDIAARATDLLVSGSDVLIWGIDRRLERFDTAVRAVTATRDGVTGVAMLDGAVWAAAGPGTIASAAAVARLDPTTLEPVGIVELPAATETDQLVASPDRLWVWTGVGENGWLEAIRPLRSDGAP